MTLLWLAFAVLLLLAAWLLILPLRRAAKVERLQRALEDSDDAAAQNVAVYRRRVASLEAAKSRGDIDAARFDEDLSELQRSLLDDTERLKRSPLKSAAAGKLAVPLVLVAVVAALVVGIGAVMRAVVVDAPVDDHRRREHGVSDRRDSVCDDSAELVLEAVLEFVACLGGFSCQQQRAETHGESCPEQACARAGRSVGRKRGRHGWFSLSASCALGG